jgi:site-specific DNA recombinase
MRIASYIRVSSQDQKKEGTSLMVQQKQIQAFCDMKGYSDVTVYEDGAVSGGKPMIERPSGSRMMADASNGKIDLILITKLDRGFRNVVDCLNTVGVLDNLGVNLILLDMGGNIVDISTPMGRFMLTTLASVAELERGMIRERCNSGRKDRKAEGKRIGEVPFGMDLGPNNVLIPNQQEQEILSTINDLKSQGETLQSIATELNTRGYSTKKGKSWSTGTVWNCLKAA